MAGKLSFTEQQQFFSPKRKRLASESVNHKHHLDTDQSSTLTASAISTKPFNVSTQHVDSEEASMNTTVLHSNSFLEGSQLHHSTATADLHHASSSHKDQHSHFDLMSNSSHHANSSSLLMDTSSSTAVLQHSDDHLHMHFDDRSRDSPMTNNNSSEMFLSSACPSTTSGVKLQPAALFASGDPAMLRKHAHQNHHRGVGTRKSVKTRLSHVVKADIFSNPSLWQSPTNASSNSNQHATLRSNNPVSAMQYYSSEEDEDDDENINRLLSESDTSMDKKLDTNNSSATMTDTDITGSPIYVEHPMSFLPTTTMSRKSRTSDAEHQLHHQWLTENVNNFTKGCDLYEVTNNHHHQAPFPFTATRSHHNHHAASSADHHQVHYNQATSSVMTAPSPVKSRFRSPKSMFMGSPSNFDFGTPVTEAGSPAVLEGIEYPEGGEDSVMDISRDSSHFSDHHVERRIFDSAFHDSQKKQHNEDVDDDDLYKYDLFARNVIGNNPSTSHKLHHHDLEEEDEDDFISMEPSKTRRRSNTNLATESPSSGHHVSDLSSASMFLDSYHKDTTRSSIGNGNNNEEASHFSFDDSTSSLHGGSQRDLSKSGISYSSNRPLPDLAAFDNTQAKTNQSFESQSSPVCPPTPSRTPGWNPHHHHLSSAHSSASSSSSSEASDFLSMLDPGSMSEPHAFHMPAPPLMRQNSLADNKLLLAQSESPRVVGNVQFYRDFIIEGQIGSGTFAEVYKVRVRSNPTTTVNSFSSSSSISNVNNTNNNEGSPVYYAIKKIKKQFRSKKDREWLLNEVRIMKEVTQDPCPYIIQFVRAWQENNFFYVQMGLAEKGTLKDLANSFVQRNEVFSHRTVWHIIHDMVAGLYHIHSHGIVHLDIKPANILINSSGIMQIGDFGMASHIGSKEDGNEGDTRYMAPELLNVTERLPSADIFSLGLSIYEMCFTLEQIQTGQLLLPTDGPQWHKLREGDADPVQNRPESMVQIIQSMLNPDYQTRPTASHFLNLPEVVAMHGDEDPALLDAPSIVLPPRVFYRSSSFQPILSVTSENDADANALMMELLARAITPH